MLKLKLQCLELATQCKELTYCKRPCCWERLNAGGEGMTEDEMVRRHHQLDGHEFKQASGVGDGQGSLTWYSSWVHKDLDTIELN